MFVAFRDVTLTNLCSVTVGDFTDVALSFSKVVALVLGNDVFVVVFLFDGRSFGTSVIVSVLFFGFS